MAVSPIDISMIQKMNDVSQMKHNEMMRPDTQQNVIAQDIQKQVNVQAEQVVHQDDSAKSNTEHDAREKGKNTYFKNKSKSKKKMEETGTVKIKHKGSFDIKI